MPGRRETFTRDKKRNSTARKRTHKDLLETQKQQSQVFQRLWTQAKDEAKASASQS
jgi:hypothetical protein